MLILDEGEAEAVAPGFSQLRDSRAVAPHIL